VEKLGAMTPEELEEIPGIGPKMVEKIQVAVNNYYGQYEEAMAGSPDAVAAVTAVIEAIPAGDTSEVQPVAVAEEATDGAAEPVLEKVEAETHEVASAPTDERVVFEAESGLESSRDALDNGLVGSESDTIEDAE